MSDETPTAETAAPAPVPAPPAQPEAPATEATDWQAEAEKWKALSRQNETAAKANAEKAKRFDEVEEASKSELQKALDRAAALEADATASKLEALRARTASLTGVPEALLHGTTAEELQASADAAIAFAKTQAPKAPPASGAELSGPGETGQLTEEQFQLIKNDPEAIVAAQKAGKLRTLLGG